MKPNIMLSEQGITESEEPIDIMGISPPPHDVTDIIQEQQACSQTPPDALLLMNEFVYIFHLLFNLLFFFRSDHLQNLRSRKIKKKRSTMSIERLASISPTRNNDLFLKLIECLRDPKIITFKYILILACLCFSILIIFIHK